MSDKKQFRRRVLLRIIGHPITTWSGVTGFALGTAAFLVHDPALPLFASICAFVVSGAMAGYNLLYRVDDLTKDTIKSIQSEEEEKVAHRLNILRQTLAQDHDPRDERALDDLIALVVAFRDEQSIVRELDPMISIDILAGVDRLFEQCVSALEGSVRNRDLIERLSADAAAPLKESREQVIVQVQEGVRELGNILSGAQKLVARKRASDGSAQAIASETSDLRQSLELAQRVEERMRGFEGSSQYDEYVRPE